MRGVLKWLKMKKFQIQNTNSFFTNLSKWVILNQPKTNKGKRLKSDAFKALHFDAAVLGTLYLVDFYSTVFILQQKL